MITESERRCVHSIAARCFARGLRRWTAGLATAAVLALTCPVPVAAQLDLTQGTVTFRYWPQQARLAQALAATLGDGLRMPGLPSDALGPDTVFIYLAPNSAIFDSLAPDVPDWSGGIAFPQGGRIVLPAFGERLGSTPLQTTMRHELAHVALRRYLGLTVPRWFHEGYAQLATGSWRAEDAWRLRIAILMGQVPPLESLTLNFPRERLRAEHAYLLSYTAVEHLQALGGAGGFRRLLERWRELGDLDRALRHTYGLTLGQFQSLWRKQLRGRYGWLLLVTQATMFWAALTILLLVLGYWKVRRDRRKLAHLKEMEARSEWEVGEGMRGEPDAWPGDTSD